MNYQAIFFDGLSSSPHSVHFSLNDQELVINSPDKAIVYQRKQCEIASAFSDAGYRINLSDGARLEVRDASFHDYLQANESSFNRNLNWLKHKPVFILMALLLSTLAVIYFLTDGLPIVAKLATKAFPVKTENRIGKYIIDSDYFEKSLFQLSSLSLIRQEQIQKNFARYCAKMEACPAYRIQFRQSKLVGANAFALPGGDIIVTDDLVNLAGNDNEINAVLAHELGHIAMRHSLQQMIQSSLRTIILVGITGDVDSVASALPGLMFDLKYSRESEVDADNYAIAFMEKNCISPNAFVKIMGKIAEDRTKKDDLISIKEVKKLFSTHPSYLERAMKFQSRSTHCN
jgi:Zn-dependent protease with chaperone function